MAISNWILKKHIDHIEVISESYYPFYKNYCKDRGVPINEKSEEALSFVNWNLYGENYFNFFYERENCEEAIKLRLKKSCINSSKKVIMDYGYDGPVIELDSRYFIENWYDFVIGAHYESALLFDDGKYIIEFHRNGYVSSNFSF